MTALAAANYYNDNARTQGEGKQTIEDLIQVAKETLGGALESTLTIAAGSITPAGASHAVDTEAAAATDDLTNIALTNHPDGRVIFLHIVSGARKVVVKQAAGGNGQVFLTRAVDLTLKVADTILVLQRRGTSWYEIGIWFGSVRTAPLTMQGAAFNTAQATAIANTTAALALDEIDGQVASLTSTVNITSVTLANGRSRWARAAGSFTIVNGASLVTQTGANYAATANDILFFFALDNVVYVLIWRPNGKALAQDSQLTSVNVAANTATLDVAMPNAALFSSAKVVVDYLYPQTNSENIQVRFSFDGGATYKSDAFYDYFFNARSILAGSAANVYGDSDEAQAILNEPSAGNQVANSLAKAWAGVLFFAGFSVNGTRKRATFQGNYTDDAGTRDRDIVGSLLYSNSTLPLTHIRFLSSSGNINGQVRVIGERSGL